MTFIGSDGKFAEIDTQDSPKSVERYTYFSKSSSRYPVKDTYTVRRSYRDAATRLTHFCGKPPSILAQVAPSSRVTWM